MSLPANEGDHTAGQLHGTGSLALAQISCVNGPGRWSNLQIILNVTLQRSQQPAIMLHHIMLEHHHASLGSFPMIPKFPISSPRHAWRRSCHGSCAVAGIQASHVLFSMAPWGQGYHARVGQQMACKGNACKLPCRHHGQR